VDPTTDPFLKSFIPVSEYSDFPIQNLPYGIFKIKNENPRVGVAIGEMILDLSVIEDNGFFRTTNLKEKKVFTESSLNKFMGEGKEIWSQVRLIISKLLSANEPVLRDNSELRQKALIAQKKVQMLMPVQIGNYTDFYSSKEHATNVGIMFRGKDNALMPNWLHLPVAYHGRASSVIVSGTNIHRPKGQTKADDASGPTFGPSRLLDFELEMGFFIGPGNELGNPVTVDKAAEHIFGMVLVNDWSARDIQKWEYQPLGPFLSKNFATSISPWIITLEALEPFRCGGPEQNPQPLPYLQVENRWSYDINLQVSILPENSGEPFAVCNSNFKYLYWNICQQLAHHTVTGCNLEIGDLLASGTISGSTPDSYGSMLELTWRGTKPIKLPNGDERKFLVDGDTVIIKGWCQAEKYRVGFGEVKCKILPSLR